MKYRFISLTQAFSYLVSIFCVALLGCETDFSLSQRKSNLDCEAGAVLVNGRCISDESECRILGALVPVSEVVPHHTQNIQSMNITMDRATGAVHYCYFGFADGEFFSFYGKQQGSRKYQEDPILLDGEPVLCGAIEIAADGTPFLISLDRAKIVYKNGNGNWKGSDIPLDGNDKAKKAVAHRNSVISLVSHGASGMSLAMSLGADITKQALYVSDITDPENPNVLVNGWLDDGEHCEIVGYSPTMLMGEGDARWISYSKPDGFTVHLSDADLENELSTEGGCHKAKLGPEGDVFLLYVDNSRTLRFDKFGQDSIHKIASLKTFDGSLSLKRPQIGNFEFDKSGNAKIVYYDETSGKGTVVYKMISYDGEVSSPQIVTTNLWQRDRRGTQDHALSVDMCGRARIAVIEETDESSDDLGTAPKITVMEER